MTPGTLTKSEEKKIEKASFSVLQDVIEEEFPNQNNAINTIQTQLTDDQNDLPISSEPFSISEIIDIDIDSDFSHEIIHEDSQSIQAANNFTVTDDAKQPVGINDCNPSVNEKDLKMLSLLDFAGQSAYYACHHIFFSPRAFFILVIDMTKKLTDVATEACREENLIYSNWTYAGKL